MTRPDIIERVASMAAQVGPMTALFEPDIDLLRAVVAAPRSRIGDRDFLVVVVTQDIGLLRALWRSSSEREDANAILFYHGDEWSWARDFPLDFDTIVMRCGPEDQSRRLALLSRRLSNIGRIICVGETLEASAPAIVEDTRENGIYVLRRSIQGSFPSSNGKPDSIDPKIWDYVRTGLINRYFGLESAPHSTHTPVSEFLTPLREDIARKFGKQHDSQRMQWPYQSVTHRPLPPSLPDGRPWPRISIITPSFNQGAFIEETILSVANQHYPNAEHIVIDGGSTDNTSDILDAYLSCFSYAVSEQDCGQSHAINKGMAKATGDILTWLNSDDMLQPGALEAMAIAFCTHDVDMVAGIVQVHSNGVITSEHLTSCDDGVLPIDDILDLDKGWNAGQFFYQPEVFFKRTLWEKAGGHVDEQLYYSMDYELWLRFAEQQARLHVIGRPIVLFRAHEGQKTSIAEKFKKELVEVRDAYLHRTKRTLPTSARSDPHLHRKLRVAVINDIGWHYGAGLAQKRLCEALLRGGCVVHNISLAEKRLFQNDPWNKADALVEELEGFFPDLIVIGNVHAVRALPETLMTVFHRWPTFIFAHDFWWVTGRCAYPRDCVLFKTGCTAECPTSTEYPSLAPDQIAASWRNKRLIMAGQDAPVLLANSRWTAEMLAEAFTGNDSLTVSPPQIERIHCSFPVAKLRPIDRRLAREMLGLPCNRFIIMASATSLQEKRKGAQHLFDALKQLALPDVLIICVGDGAPAHDKLDLEVRSLGYIEDISHLAMAYAAADIFVGPSLQETYGQVFAEAICCGTPAVGFPVSGVLDAIVDGVTGYFAAGATTDDLAAVLLQVYRDSEHRSYVERWGRIYAENEWSPEAGYHHFFNMLRRTGMVDRLGLPHKIGFFQDYSGSMSTRDVQGTKNSWHAVFGVGYREGPYPEWNLARSFFWCVSPKSVINIDCAIGGPHFLTIEYLNFIPDQVITLSLNREGYGEFKLELATGPNEKCLSISASLQTGSNILEMTFAKSQLPTDAEKRHLAMMLREIHLSRCEIPAL